MIDAVVALKVWAVHINYVYHYLWRFKIVDFYPPLSQSVTNLESPKSLLKKIEQDMQIPAELFYVNSI